MRLSFDAFLNPLEFLSKKHVNFGQGLIFSSLARKIEEKTRKTEEHTGKQSEKLIKLNKYRNRDSHFLLTHFFLNSLTEVSDL